MRILESVAYHTPFSPAFIIRGRCDNRGGESSSWKPSYYHTAAFNPHAEWPIQTTRGNSLTDILKLKRTLSQTAIADAARINKQPMPVFRRWLMVNPTNTVPYLLSDPSNSIFLHPPSNNLSLQHDNYEIPSASTMLQHDLSGIQNSLHADYRGVLHKSLGV